MLESSCGAVLALVGLAVLPAVERIFSGELSRSGHAFRSRSGYRFRVRVLAADERGIPHRISLSMGLAGLAGSDRRLAQPSRGTAVASFVPPTSTFLSPSSHSRRARAFNPRSSVPRSTWTSRSSHAGRAEHFRRKTRGCGDADQLLLRRLPAVATWPAWPGSLRPSPKISRSRRSRNRREHRGVDRHRLTGSGEAASRRGRTRRHGQLDAGASSSSSTDDRGIRLLAADARRPAHNQRVPFFSFMPATCTRHVHAARHRLALIGVAVAPRTVPADASADAHDVARLGIVALLLAALSIANPWTSLYLTLLDSSRSSACGRGRWLRALVPNRLDPRRARRRDGRRVLPFTTQFRPMERHRPRPRADDARPVPHRVRIYYCRRPSFTQRLFAELRRIRRRATSRSPRAFAPPCSTLATKARCSPLPSRSRRGAARDSRQPFQALIRGSPRLRGDRGSRARRRRARVRRDPTAKSFTDEHGVQALLQAWLLLALASVRSHCGSSKAGEASHAVAPGPCPAASRVALLSGRGTRLRRQAMAGGLSLDGKAYLEHDHANDGCGDPLLDASARGLPVVLEATGDAYSYLRAGLFEPPAADRPRWSNTKGLAGTDPRIAMAHARRRESLRRDRRRRARELLAATASATCSSASSSASASPPRSTGFALGRSCFASVYRAGATEVFEVPPDRRERVTARVW